MVDYAMVSPDWDMPTARETKYYYLHDALGSVVGLVGGNLDEWLVGRDLVANLLEPHDYRSGDNCLAYLRHQNFSSHRRNLSAASRRRQGMLCIPPLTISDGREGILELVAL